MVELDAPEFWELVFLFPRSGNLVDRGRRKNRSHGNDTGDELIVFSSSRVKDGGSR